MVWHECRPNDCLARTGEHMTAAIMCVCVCVCVLFRMFCFVFLVHSLHLGAGLAAPATAKDAAERGTPPPAACPHPVSRSAFPNTTCLSTRGIRRWSFSRANLNQQQHFASRGTRAIDSATMPCRRLCRRSSYGRDNKSCANQVPREASSPLAFCRGLSLKNTDITYDQLRGLENHHDIRLQLPHKKVAMVSFWSCSRGAICLLSKTNKNRAKEYARVLGV
jgi:hypothetical protein